MIWRLRAFLFALLLGLVPVAPTEALTPTQQIVLFGNVVNLSSCPSQALTYFASLATQPTPTRKLAYCNLISALIAAGTWQTADSIQVYAAADQATASTPLVGPSPTNHGATFVADKGFQGNATSFYLDTGFNPTGATNYALNGATVSAYDITSRSAACSSNACALVGASSGGGALAYLYPLFSGGPQTYALLNSGTNSNINGLTQVQGFWAITRSISTTQIFYQNGTQLLSTAATSTSVPNTKFFALALDTSGTASNFNSDIVGAFMSGGAQTPTQITATYVAFHTYMQAVAGVP